jgi:hypothetical protein
MVTSVSAYRWSSYLGNAGLSANQLLSPHSEYLALSDKEEAPHIAYQGMLCEDDDPTFLAAIRDATNGGFGMISDALKSRLPVDTQTRLQRKSAGRKPVAKPEEGLTQLALELGLRPGRK